MNLQRDESHRFGTRVLTLTRDHGAANRTSSYLFIEEDIGYQYEQPLKSESKFGC